MVWTVLPPRSPGRQRGYSEARQGPGTGSQPVGDQGLQLQCGDIMESTVWSPLAVGHGLPQRICFIGTFFDFGSFRDPQ